MTQNFYSIVTQIGLEKQLNCLNDLTDFEISEIAVGDSNGEYYEPSEEQTELKNELWRGKILTHGVKNGQLYATTSIPLDIGGFTIREIGLFDSNNRLLCIAKCPETNKHHSDEGGAQELFIKIYMSLSNSDLAPLIVQESSQMASVEFVEQTFATQDLDNLTIVGQEKFNSKQDKLIEGEGIQIINNTISAPKELPSQTSNNGKILKTDGTNVYWDDLPSSYNLFDIVQKDYILDYEESFGFARLGTYVYKEAVAGVRYGYPDFYAKCKQEYENGTPIWIASNVTKQGDIIDNQGVLSGFNANKYAVLPKTFNPGDKTWEIMLKVNTGSGYPNTNAPLFRDGTREFDGFVLYGRSGGILDVHITSDGANWNIAKNVKSTIALQPSTDYYIRSRFTGESYTVDVSTDKIEWTNYITVESSLPIYSNLNRSCIGWEQYGYYWTGSIDLNECYIKIDGEYFWKGTIDGSKLTNGHIYYDISDKEYIDEIYINKGAAWFYGLDTENERVFLPRNDWFFQNGDEPGKFTDAGLPNITGATAGMQTANQQGSPYGAFYAEYVTNTTDQSWGGSGDYYRQAFNAARCSKVYGGSNTVQPKSITNIIYIVVGNVKREAQISNVINVTSSDNDTIPLFTPKIFGFTPNHLCWLRAGEQRNCNSLYSFIYNKLVNAINGDNPHNIKVIDSNDMESGVDYGEYWRVNQDTLQFCCPIKTEDRILIDKKIATPTDTTWYNLYSDGYCEQGGYGNYGSGSININLPKTYRDTNFDVIATCRQNNLYATAGIRSVSTIWIETRGHDYTVQNCNCTWRTQGYVELNANDYVLNSLYFKVANSVENLELLNAGAVLQAVNEINTQVSNMPHVIETYNNGNSGYRLWSDGYCEQWGLLDYGSDFTNTGRGFSITFILPFKDIYYYPTLQYMGNSTGSSYGSYVAVQFTSKSTAGFSGYIWKTETSNRFIGWKATGYVPTGV